MFVQSLDIWTIYTSKLRIVITGEKKKNQLLVYFTNILLRLMCYILTLFSVVLKSQTCHLLTIAFIILA